MGQIGNVDRYYRKAFYPGVAERSQAALVQLGPAQTVDNLRFFLPQDLPAPSIPLQVTVLGRDGRLIPNAEILFEDDMWEHGGLVKCTHSEGNATLLLRKGEYYNVWAVVNPDGQECAEPVGVLAEEGLKPVGISAQLWIEIDASCDHWYRSDCAFCTTYFWLDVPVAEGFVVRRWVEEEG